jgi:hypothetical protein
MAIRIEPILNEDGSVATNPDGTPLLHYISDGPVVITGPISGDVVLPDGEHVDVTAPLVEARDDEHAAAIASAIGDRHEVEGHPDFVRDPDVDSFGFVHSKEA